MAGPDSKLLTKVVNYTGDKMSVRSLEDSISTVRASQNDRVGELKTLRERNVQIQASLSEEIKKLRKFSDYLHRADMKGGFLANIKELLSYLPFVNRLWFTKRSIEDLLRQQYEISARRTKEAAEFADKLKAAETDLYNEIDRLNDKIVAAAKNEELAVTYVLELEELKKSLETELAAVSKGSTSERELQAQADQTRRLLSEHSTQLQLYHTSEERMARLKENTRKLAETIGNLASDIRQYVNAASEKLDLVSGQVQAIGTAADASVVMLELKQSLDVMTESMNQTTQFVSETQAFFRANLDNLMAELELYDDETREIMDKNLAMSREVEERRIADAVELALARRRETEGAGAASGG